MGCFCDLHNHSAYSLLDSISRVDELVQRAVDLGQKAVAITDHGSLHSLVKLHEACRKLNEKSEQPVIKPIFGCELYTVPDATVKTPENRTSYHLVVWARTDEGLSNLIQLSSLGYLEGFYYKPRVDHRMLADLGKGLIGTSACLSSEINRLVMAGEEEEAIQRIQRFKGFFDEFFLEIQAASHDDQIELNRRTIELARRLDLPLIVTNDTHYVYPDDAQVHDLALRIRQPKRSSKAVSAEEAWQSEDSDDADRLRFASADFYLKSEEEVRRILSEQGLDAKAIDEAVANTRYVAEACEAKLETGVWKLPQAPVPEECSSSIEAVRAKALGGLLRYAQKHPEIEFPRYLERLNYELGVIEEAGISDYLLIVADVCRWAHQNRIPMGPGRGSAGGSLVVQMLGITHLDPIKFGLSFERFYVPGRKNLPDIDLDFDPPRRAEVINYLAERYGRDRVAHIRTFHTLKPRSVIKDVARVLPVHVPGEEAPRRLTYAEAEAIAEAVPELVTDEETQERLKITIDVAMEHSPKLREYEAMYPELFRVARRLEGLPRHLSKHAGGVVIAPVPVREILPAMRNVSEDGSVLDEFILTQLDMEDAEALGLLKLDVLGVDEVGTIARAAEWAKSPIHSSYGSARDEDRETFGVIDWNALPLDDPKIYAMLSKGHTFGLFQVGTGPGTRCVKEVQPTKIEHLIDIAALVRPGPQKSGQTEQYVRCHKGLDRVEYPHPALEPVLSRTYGQILYQEQLMAVCRILAGFTHSQADDVRKATSKKRPEILRAAETEFLEGCQAVGIIDPYGAQEIFEQLKRFGDYSFNLAHAAAYAVICYYTAWLKLYHPVEFMAAVMSVEARSSGQDRIEKLAAAVQECRRMGVKLLLPDINRSDAGFLPWEGHVLWGLSAIAGVGAQTVASILDHRPFASLEDFIDKVPKRDCNKRAATALILSGAFDAVEGVGELKDRLALLERYYALRKEEVPKTIKLGGKSELAIPRRVTPNTIFHLEKGFLGTYVTVHPYGATDLWAQAEVGEDDIEITAQVVDYHKRTVKRGRSAGQEMAILRIDTAGGRLKAILWPPEWKKLQNSVSRNAVLRLIGRKDDEETLIVRHLKPVKDIA